MEDFTEKGLEDLKNEIIRTPLPAYETFQDDPLRVLRVFRFASKYGFKVHDSILEAIKGEEIKTALMSKVSRERIGTEVLKSLSHSNGLRFVKLLSDAHIWNLILFPPKDILQTGTLSAENFKEILKKNTDIALHIFDKHEVYDELACEWAETDQDSVLSILSALLYGFQKVQKNKNIRSIKKLNLLEFYVREGMKLSKYICRDVNTICEATDMLNTTEKTAAKIAHFINFAKQLWPYSLILWSK